MSLHAFDSDNSYFAWAQFGKQALDVMMLIDTGASISLLPQSFWEELQEEFKEVLQPSQVEIEVGNGGNLDSDGTTELTFLLSDYEFEHVFFVCKDSATAWETTSSCSTAYSSLCRRVG